MWLEWATPRAAMTPWSFICITFNDSAIEINILIANFTILTANVLIIIVYMLVLSNIFVLTNILYWLLE